MATTKQKPKVLPVISVNPSDLTPHPDNPNTHPDDQIAQIVGAIHRHGWTRTAVITEKNVILGGHAAIEAAVLAGLDEITVSLYADASEADQLLLLHQDNQLGKNGEMDIDANEKLIRRLYADAEIDNDELAISESELKRILKKTGDGSGDGDGDGYSDPIIQYNIVFDNESQQNQWYAFMKQVRLTSHGETFAESLEQWITDNVEFTE